MGTTRVIGSSGFRRISALLPILVLGLACTAVAQVPPPSVLPASGQGAAADTVDLPFSPRGAFFRSLLLPGWGQAYVGAPMRGAVYFSLASGSVWMAYVSRRQLADARREQHWLRESGAIGPTQETAIALSREQQFEDWAALSVFLFFFSGADAYVSAYLADFSDRVGVRPGAEGELRINMNIPVGSPR